MKHKSVPIQDQLLELLKKYNLEEPFLENEIKENWSKILPKQLAAVTELDKVDNGVLTVRVKNEHWKKEIIKRKEELLNLIQLSVKEITIKNIYIV